MRSDLTDITLVVDRSGSMQSIRDDAEGGVNAFIESQAKEPGEALLTLVQFDTEYEFLHKGVPVSQASGYTLRCTQVTNATAVPNSSACVPVCSVPPRVFCVPVCSVSPCVLGEGRLLQLIRILQTQILPSPKNSLNARFSTLPTSLGG